MTETSTFQIVDILSDDIPFSVKKDNKTVKEKRTYSGIRELSEHERVEEIARMSGGKKITKTTLSHAREMIQP